MSDEYEDVWADEIYRDIPLTPYQLEKKRLQKRRMCFVIAACCGFWFGLALAIWKLW
jgi:hypothetical protein